MFVGDDTLDDVVDMRPMRQVHTTTDATGRRLTTRHVVRGHWTHQPYGPKRSLRRLQWVAPFIRGPEAVSYTHLTLPTKA